jgi:hypothetical protein
LTQPRQSLLVINFKPSATARSSPSVVRAFTLHKYAFNSDHMGSISEKSGEYGGSQPPWPSTRARFPRFDSRGAPPNCPTLKRRQPASTGAKSFRKRPHTPASQPLPRLPASSRHRPPRVNSPPTLIAHNFSEPLPSPALPVRRGQSAASTSSSLPIRQCTGAVREPASSSCTKPTPACGGFSQPPAAPFFTRHRNSLNARQPVAGLTVALFSFATRSCNSTSVTSSGLDLHGPPVPVWLGQRLFAPARCGKRSHEPVSCFCRSSFLRKVGPTEHRAAISAMVFAPFS